MKLHPQKSLLFNGRAKLTSLQCTVIQAVLLNRAKVCAHFFVFQKECLVLEKVHYKDAELDYVLSTVKSLLNAFPMKHDTKTRQFIS